MNSIVSLWNVIFNLAATLTRTNEIMTAFNERAERSLGLEAKEELLVLPAPAKKAKSDK